MGEYHKENSKKSDKKRFGLVPLQNFAFIYDNIYRCAQPIHEYQWKWLEGSLGVNTVINLRKENDVDHKFCEKLGIKEFRFLVPDHEAPTEEQAKEFMEIVKRERKPILIHCEYGHGRTSTFSVLAKVAMGYGIEEALKDEKKRFHYSFAHRHQEEFLRKFLYSLKDTK